MVMFQKITFKSNNYISVYLAINYLSILHLTFVQLSAPYDYVIYAWPIFQQKWFILPAKEFLLLLRHVTELSVGKQFFFNCTFIRLSVRRTIRNRIRKSYQLLFKIDCSIFLRRSLFLWKFRDFRLFFLDSFLISFIIFLSIFFMTSEHLV